MRRSVTLQASGTIGCGELVMRGVDQLQLAATADSKSPRFDMVAYTGGPIRPDRPYLEAPLIIELAGVSSPDRITANLDHDDTKIVGQTDRVKIGTSDIRMSGIITGDATANEEECPAAKVVKHAARGYIWPVSLGGDIQQIDYVQPGVSTKVNGQRVEGPIYIARKVALKHIAFLSVPADQAATARIAASRRKESTMNFHEWLKGLGFEDPAALSESQRNALQAKYDAEVKLAAAAAKKDDPPKKDEPKKPARSAPKLAEIRAREARKSEIETLAARYAEQYPQAIDEIETRQTQAIEDENMTAADFETLLLRECTRHERIDNRPRGRSESQADSAPVLEVALCRLGGTTEDTLVKKYGQQVVEASQRRFRRGLSLREFLELSAAANGFRGRFRDESEDVLAHALPDRRMRGRDRLSAAGPSTYDVADILSNVLNRFIVDYFMGVDQSAMRKISAIRPVSDFRQIESYSLTGDMQFEKVAPGGEIKHGTLGNEKYTNQADTYGKLIGIDRRDIINDDLNAFTKIGMRLGRGGALALMDVFWAEFINNSAFFTTARANLDEGSDTALSNSALTLAKTMFNKLTDPNGKPMNITPKILLVPPELEGTAKQILNSQLIVMGGTAAAIETQGNANIHAGTLDLAMARELSNSNYTGYSLLKWYVLAAPMDVPVIETVFLNGVDRPTVENAQADFNILGITMRGYFDFGCALQEYRGGVAMKGEV